MATCKGIILHNHGIFIFDDDAKKSYDKMIEVVSKAEDFLKEHAKVDIEPLHVKNKIDLEKLKKLLPKYKK